MTYSEIQEIMKAKGKLSFKDVTLAQVMMIMRDRYIKYYDVANKGTFEVNIIPLELTPKDYPKGYSIYIPDDEQHTSHIKLIELLDNMMKDYEMHKPIVMILEYKRYNVIIEQLETNE